MVTLHGPCKYLILILILNLFFALHLSTLSTTPSRPCQWWAGLGKVVQLSTHMQQLTARIDWLWRYLPEKFAGSRGAAAVSRDNAAQMMRTSSAISRYNLHLDQETWGCGHNILHRLPQLSTTDTRLGWAGRGQAGLLTLNNVCVGGQGRWAWVRDLRSPELSDDLPCRRHPTPPRHWSAAGPRSHWSARRHFISAARLGSAPEYRCQAGHWTRELLLWCLFPIAAKLTYCHYIQTFNKTIPDD